MSPLSSIERLRPDDAIPARLDLIFMSGGSTADEQE